MFSNTDIKTAQNKISVGVIYVVVRGCHAGQHEKHTLRTSAKIGTVELTGLEMTRKHALGQLLEHCSAMPLTIEAFVLNRSSLGTIFSHDLGKKGYRYMIFYYFVSKKET